MRAAFSRGARRRHHDRRRHRRGRRRRRVRAHVPQERARVHEPAAATAALVRPLPTVAAAVRGERRGGVEHRVAHVAPTRAGSGVRAMHEAARASKERPNSRTPRCRDAVASKHKPRHRPRNTDAGTHAHEQRRAVRNADAHALGTICAARTYAKPHTRTRARRARERGLPRVPPLVPRERAPLRERRLAHVAPTRAGGGGVRATCRANECAPCVHSRICVNRKMNHKQTRVRRARRTCTAARGSASAHASRASQPLRTPRGTHRT